MSVTFPEPYLRTFLLLFLVVRIIRGGVGGWLLKCAQTALVNADKLPRAYLQPCYKSSPLTILLTTEIGEPQRLGYIRLSWWKRGD